MDGALTKIARFTPKDRHYEAAISLTPDSERPAFIDTIGNIDLLSRRKIGLLCSVQCPGDVILKTIDLMGELRDADVCVISGFHSPLEQECLQVLLKGRCGLTICPARGLEGMRIPSEYREPLNSGRLLLLSAFGQDYERKSKASADIRNRLVTAVSDILLVPYASPGGKTEALCREVADQGRELICVPSSHNSNLSAIGARAAEGVWRMLHSTADVSAGTKDITA